MKKLSFLLALTVLTGCKSLKPVNPNADHNYVVLQTNTIPTPPGVFVQKSVSKKSSIRALSLAPDKWIVARWDQSLDAQEYVIKWEPIDMGQGLDSPNGEYLTALNKVDMVALFKQEGVPRGWYRLQVRAVNALYVRSDPVLVPSILWWP